MKIKYPDYTNSIMNVSNTFLHYYGIKTDYNGIKELENELQSKPDHIIYILLDGMGINIVNNLLKENDCLRKYVRKEITSVFPPTTVAATNAVLSGTPPITTGYLGWVQYFEQENTDVTVFLNNDFYNPEKTFDYSVRDRYLSYKNITTKIKEKCSDVESGIIFPEYIGGVSKSFEHALEIALLKAHNNDKSFSYVYWTDPDLTEHPTGIYSNETKNMLISLNEDVKEFFDNLPQNSLVTIIADHGLTDVDELDLLQYETLLSYLKRMPSLEPRAMNFFVKDEFKNEFKDEFNKHFKDVYMLLTKEELLNQNLFGKGIKHQLIDMFLGDYIAIATSNILFKTSSAKIYKAHHAGLLEDEMMVPLIIYKK